MDATAPDYSTKVVKFFVVASVIWALVGMLIGLSSQPNSTGLFSISIPSTSSLGDCVHCIPLGSYTASW